MALPRELLRYTFSTAALLVQTVLLLRSVRRGRRQTVAPDRPVWDASWFVPLYLGGVESLLHLALWLEGMARRGVVPPASLMLAHGAFSGTILLVLLVACALEDWAAPRLRTSARAMVAALPPPVLAGFLGVAATWGLTFLALYA